MSKPFYITTPVYYMNGAPHIGHAYTTVAADVLARFKKLQEEEVFFSTGADEHGLKIQRKAKEAGKEPQEFVDENVARFQELWRKLDIDYTKFARTTDPAHKQAVQKVLQDLHERGIIYKGFYEGRYCVGCERFKTDDELADGKCREHNMIPELLKEETYLMKMAAAQKELLEKIESNALHITPEKYKTEMLSFLRSENLQDVSISRKHVSWGIPLPFDESHTTYVWVDAFLSYLTVLGWSGDKNTLPAEWPVDAQIIGKDILRVHATIWPILLMHLGVPTPKLLLAHGHILSGGKKMSKTLGNVISADEMLEKFGVDGTRYILMSAGTFGDDLDLTMERMTEKYNADLANGLGNLVSRVLKLASQLKAPNSKLPTKQFPKNFLDLLNDYKLDEGLKYIWNIVSEDNKYIEETKPWELVKNDKAKFEEVIQKLLKDIALIAHLLQPFLPETSRKIETALQAGAVEPLFQRI